MAETRRHYIPDGCCKQAWLLKNSLFVPNTRNWGDRKCLGDPRKSIVGLPDAILFLRISWERVFQQPQAIALMENFRPTIVWDAPLLRLQPRWKYPLLSRTRTLFRGGRLEGVLRGAFFLELLINAVHQFLNFAVFVTLRVVRAGFHGASLPHARLRAQIASNFNSRSAFGGPVDGVITRRVVPAGNSPCGDIPCSPPDRVPTASPRQRCAQRAARPWRGLREGRKWSRAATPHQRT